MNKTLDILIWVISYEYVQSNTMVQRPVFVRIPFTINLRPNSIFLVERPIFSLSGAVVHWFLKYHTHHREALAIHSFTTNPCFYCIRNGFLAIGLGQSSSWVRLSPNRWHSKRWQPSIWAEKGACIAMILIAMMLYIFLILLSLCSKAQKLSAQLFHLYIIT